MTLQSLWSEMSGKTLPTYPSTFQLPVIDGQSLPLGVNGSPAERSTATYWNRAALRQVSGLQRSDDVAVSVHGPGNLNYNAAQATGLDYAAPLGNIPMVLIFAAALDLWRRRLSLPLQRMAVGFNGIAGQNIVEFDRDPATGTLGTRIRDNHLHWITEARRVAPNAAPLVYGMCQGEANAADAQGVYFPKAVKAYDAALADIETATGARPPVMVFQTGGNFNTSSVPWGCCLDQLDLVRHYSGIFAGPIYPGILTDGTHPDLTSSIISSEIAAMVFARHEQGQRIDLMPGTPLWTGNTVRIPFEGLGGKALQFDGSDLYGAYGGLNNHGVEATGAAITSVTLDGDAVVVACDGPMTRVQIAMQAADQSAALDGQGRSKSAHRCDIRESAAEDSLLLPGTPLKRFIPSCRFDRPA